MKKTFFPRIAGKVRSVLFGNGLRVFIIPKYEAPTVTVQAWVATGSIHEERNLGCGLSHFLEHMLFQGSEKFPGNAVADAVTHFGGCLNAYTSKTHTVYYINLPAVHWAEGAAMLDDMLRNPLFPEEKFRSEKDVILRECAMYLDSPESSLYEKFVREAYLIHPFRHPVIGYRDKIESVTRDMMCAYHAARYTPGRTFYVIAGAVDPDVVVETLCKQTESWKTGSLSEPALPVEPDIMAKRETTVRFNDPMTRTICGWRIPPATHSDLPAIEIFGDILGGSSSSRLTQILQNEKELALDIDTCLFADSVAGISCIFASCLEENREKLTEEVFRILDDLTLKGPAQLEIERTIAQQTADYFRAMRTETGLAQIVGKAVLYGGSVETADEYLPAMRNVTKDDLMRIGEVYFQPRKATLVHMLPAESHVSKKRTTRRIPAPEQPTLEKLKGGQRLIHLHDATLPLVDFFLMLPGGVYYETPDICGASKLIAATLCAGCAKYSEKELDEILDSHAIELAVTAGTASIRIAVNCPREHLALATELLCAILSSPLFPEKAVERERTAILEELKVKLSEPEGVAENLLASTLFGRHPYGIPLSESIRHIAARKASELGGIYRSLCLNAKKAVFGFAGAIALKEAQDTAARIIAACNWNNRCLKTPPPPDYPAKAVRKEQLLDKEQAVLFLGMPGPSALSDDIPALDILKTASSSMSSHLFQTVRNQNGLAYYTGCFNMPGINAGCVAYYAGTNAKSVAKLEKLFLAEIRRVVTKGLTEEEFADAKAQILFQLDSSMQSPDKRLAAAVTGEFIGKGYQAAMLKREALGRLTLKQVNETLRRYLSAPGKVTALVTRGSNIE